MNNRDLIFDFDAFNKDAEVAFKRLQPIMQEIGQRLEELSANLVKAAREIPPELYHGIGMLHPFEVDTQLRLEHDQYLLVDASPDEVVEYIISQPNHTWRGLTIYPDEAWRYRHNDYWMGWRR